MARTQQYKFYLHEIVSQKYLLGEVSDTDSKSETYQEGIAKVLREIVNAKKNREKNSECRRRAGERAVEALKKRGMGCVCLGDHIGHFDWVVCFKVFLGGICREICPFFLVEWEIVITFAEV